MTVGLAVGLAVGFAVDDSVGLGVEVGLPVDVSVGVGEDVAPGTFGLYLSGVFEAGSANTWAVFKVPPVIAKALVASAKVAMVAAPTSKNRCFDERAASGISIRRIGVSTNR